MSGQSRSPRIGEYWDWLAVVLFLLLTVDMLTTFAAARAVGVEAEGNPLVQWALGEGVWTVLVINLTALVVTVCLFGLLTGRLEVTRPPLDRYVGYLVEIWLGALLALGLAVFANNLSVIVHGASLF